MSDDLVALKAQLVEALDEATEKYLSGFRLQPGVLDLQAEAILPLVAQFGCDAEARGREAVIEIVLTRGSIRAFGDSGTIEHASWPPVLSEETPA